MINLGIALVELAWLHNPTDWVTQSASATSWQQAERIARKATDMGLMAHIHMYGDDDAPWYEVDLATPQWVDSYYQNGGVWGYHWYEPRPEVDTGVN